MIVYEALKHEFMQDVFQQQIDVKIRRLILEKIGINVSESEVNSWMNSLLHLSTVINTSEVPDDCGVALEYKIPNTSKRIDLILSGYDELDKPRAVIIELKQWSELEKVDGQDAIVNTILRGSRVNTIHPSYQVWSYASLIKDYNEDVRKENIELFPCAFLHNYDKRENDPLLDNSYSYYLKQAPVFIKGDYGKLRDFIKRFVKKGDQKQILYHIERGRIIPSKSLQDSVVNMVKGNVEFNMIDDQKVIYERAKHIARTSFRDRKKRVYLIEGGPGTGKSLIAINLLADLISTQNGKMCKYVSKNAAPRNVFKKKLRDGGYRVPYIDAIFGGSGVFTASDSNEFDVLIVDEAHRLAGKSGFVSNVGENQIKEIINASLISVFFIDEYQRISLKDIGTKNEIRKWAHYFNCDISEDLLISQFRCNGSDGYISWIDSILEISDKPDFSFSTDYNYDFRIVDNPNDLKNMIIERNLDNNKSRILAGYCWNWNKNKRSNPDHHDIQISEHNFAMSWNLDNTDTWAIHPESVNQVGCIHTSQGLEFDFVGVIIGEDIKYRNGNIITDFTKRAKTDASMKGIKKLYRSHPEEALKLSDEIIKNTYRTLLTRGQKGCYVYICDSNLREYFKSRMHI